MSRAKSQRQAEDRQAGGGQPKPGIAGVMLLAVLGLLFAMALAPSAQARESYAFAGTYDFGGQFGVSGPGVMAVHGESETLYTVDAPNDRILKFDISDPLNPVPEDFSALGSNAITQADGAALALEQVSNIAVDNSGGPQDGTLYLATGPAAPAAHAFADTGEWLFQFAHDGDGNFDPSGTPVPALAIGVSDAESRPGEIILIASGFGAPHTLYSPADVTGETPSVMQIGTIGGSYNSTGTYLADFTPDGSAILTIKRSLFGSNISGGDRIRSEGLGFEGSYNYGGGFGGNPAYFDGGFTSDGDLLIRSSAGTGSIAKYRQIGIANGLTGETGTLQIGEFGFGDQGSGVGIVESPAGYVYATDAANAQINIYGPATAPDAEIDEPGSVNLNTAELRATVNAQNLNITSCEFQWGATATYGNVEPCDITPSGDQDVEVTAQIPVTPRSTYNTRVVVRADNATQTASANLQFQAPDLPEAETLPAGPQQRQGTAVLGGTVDPNQTPTGYYIEYSTDPGLAGASRFPVSENVPVAVGDSPVRVAQVVPGLSNATTYYFRVVAETKAGTDAGSIESFETFIDPSQPQPSSCANQQFRSGPSRYLPDCRAWEQISVYDKNGGQVAQGATAASPDGERVTYAAGSIFAGARSLGTITEYVADRTGDGWSTRAMAPGVTIPISVVTWNALFHQRTPDLSRAVGWTTNIALPGTEPSNTTAYLWDTEQGKNFNLKSGDPLGSGRDVRGVDIADDGKSGYLLANRIPVDSGPMVPADQPSAYWWEEISTGFHVELASIMPNGEPAIVSSTGGRREALSSDGEKLVWHGSTDLYLSRRGDSTLRISEAQGVVQPATTVVTLKAWTPDLRYVYFTSPQQLTADATSQGVGQQDLYRYDTETGDLEDLTAQDAGGGAVDFVLDLSDDGSHVYFVARGNLTPDATGTGLKLYGISDGQTRLITDYPASVKNSWDFARTNGFQKIARVAGDGRYFLFPYNGTDTSGTRMDSVFETNGNQMFYRYDWDRDRFDCVTCTPVGDAATSDSYLAMPPGFRPNTAQFDGVGRERRFMTEDGRVMFNTAQALLPEDVNTKVDTYIWDGDLRLLTSGNGTHHQFAEDASPGFEDVYVLSSAQLVPRDVDGAVDLYAASIGGGLKSQQSRPIPAGERCQGSECQDNGAESPRVPRLDSLDPAAEAVPGARCAVQEARFQATAKARRQRLARFRKAKRSAQVSLRRYKQAPSAAARKRAVRSRRALKQSRAHVKRAMPVHRRSKAALARCRGGAR